MPLEPKLKPRAKCKPYIHAPRTKPKADASRTSTKKQPKYAHKNLTLSDWLVVVDYYDTYQPTSQEEVTNYFAKRPEGALIFMQSSLSHHSSQKGHEAGQQKVASNPIALSVNRPYIVTRPDVERPLVLWVKHMEEKGEQVTRPMLMMKHTKYKDALNVPAEEKLWSDGWIPNFCKT
jgi:hypothetical protein